MGKAIDMIGKKFGELTVVAKTDKRTKVKGIIWRCMCSCGNICEVDGKLLRNGTRKTCGCRKSVSEDVTGQTFGNLLAIKKVNETGPAVWLFRCNLCGNYSEILLNRVKNNGQESCGCMQHKGSKKHGLAGTKIYNTWIRMRQRCNNPNDANYRYYGARGITVCDEWNNSFDAFLRDMGESFEEHNRIYGGRNTSIERIDVDKGYCKENCKWITQAEQVRNMRSNLSYKNKKKKLSYKEQVQIVMADIERVVK